jgi:hypothetical protein
MSASASSRGWQIRERAAGSGLRPVLLKIFSGRLSLTHEEVALRENISSNAM